MNEEDLKKCIVRIEMKVYNSEDSRTLISNGTGFFIEKDKILTCYHVIKKYKDIKNIKVFLNNEESPYEVHILDINEDIDFALLKIESDNTFFVEMDKIVNVEDKCYSHGFPDKEEYNEKLEVPKDKQIKDKPLTFEYEGSDKANKLMTFKGGQFEKGFSGSPILNLSTGGVCGMIIISRDTRTDLGGEGVSIDKLSLLNYKEENKNEITETIKLENGKSFNIQLVKVELDDKNLYVGKYPVTFEEYDLFCENTNRSKPHDRGWGRGKRPVINVNWDDSNEYCKWLSTKNKEYRLPTLKEFKDIATNNTKKCDFEKSVWYKEKKTIEVDSKEIEEGDLGISHIYGNVYEWCYDKVAIGGCYTSTNHSIVKRDNQRFSYEFTYDTVGFRIIMDI